MKSTDRVIVQNLRAAPLRLHGADGWIIELGALERREIAVDDLTRFDLSKAKRAGHLDWEPYTEGKQMVLVGAGVWAVAAYFIGGVTIWKDWQAYWLVVGTALVVGFLGAGAVLARGVAESWATAKQLAAFLTVFAVSVTLPALALHLVQDVSTAPDRWLKVMELVRDADWRLFIWIFVALASLLPAVLYFLFDRTKLLQLREAFARDVVRLDPSIDGLAALRAKYGVMMDEAYGASNSALGRHSGARRSPVVVATILLTLGWVITLVTPMDLAKAMRDLPGPSAPTAVAANDAGDPATTADPGERTEANLLAPGAAGNGTKSAIHLLFFAFLGAYVFALLTIMFGYVRRDLRPKSYGQISVRLMLAFIVALLLAQLPELAGGVPVAVAAFVFGVFPTWLLQQAVQSVRNTSTASKYLPALAEGAPLTKLDGLTAFDQSRLLDEGIGNVQSLAASDLIALMMETRIGTPQLVDWLDQAILYVAAAEVKLAPGEPSDELFVRLREAGVRTATQLQERAAVDRGAPLRAALGIGDGADHAQARARLDGVVAAVARAEWLSAIHNWRARERWVAPWIGVEAAAEPETAAVAAGETPAPTQTAETAAAAARVEQTMQSLPALRPQQPPEPKTEPAPPAAGPAERRQPVDRPD